MKTILILISIFSYSFSSELLTFTLKNKVFSNCIEDYYIQDNKLYFKASYDTSFYGSIRLDKVKNYHLEAGYIYDNFECKLNDKNINNYTSQSATNLNYKNLTQLGLSQNDFNFLMALSGICISFLFLFGLFRWI